MSRKAATRCFTSARPFLRRNSIHAEVSISVMGVPCFEFLVVHRVIRLAVHHAPEKTLLCQIFHVIGDGLADGGRTFADAGCPMHRSEILFIEFDGYSVSYTHLTLPTNRE